MAGIASYKAAWGIYRPDSAVVVRSSFHFLARSREPAIRQRPPRLSQLRRQRFSARQAAYGPWSFATPLMTAINHHRRLSFRPGPLFRREKNGENRRLPLLAHGRTAGVSIGIPR